jgi:hypothetical protein
LVWGSFCPMESFLEETLVEKTMRIETLLAG